MSDDCQGFFSPESISVLKAALTPETHEFTTEAAAFTAESMAFTVEESE